MPWASLISQDNVNVVSPTNSYSSLTGDKVAVAVYVPTSVFWYSPEYSTLTWSGRFFNETVFSVPSYSNAAV